MIPGLGETGPGFFVRIFPVISRSTCDGNGKNREESEEMFPRYVRPRQEPTDCLNSGFSKICKDTFKF